jgi:hypothetical protein
MMSGSSPAAPPLFRPPMQRRPVPVRLTCEGEQASRQASGAAARRGDWCRAQSSAELLAALPG